MLFSMYLRYIESVCVKIELNFLGYFEAEFFKETFFSFVTSKCRFHKDMGSNSFKLQKHIPMLDAKKQNRLFGGSSTQTPLCRTDLSEYQKIYTLVIYSAADKGEQNRFSMMNIIEPYIKLVI